MNELIDYCDSCLQGVDVTKLTNCRECGYDFCPSCGNPTTKYCKQCEEERELEKN